MIPNVKFSNGKVSESKTLLALIKNEENHTFPTDSTEFGILGQFLCTEGKSGQVLKVKLARRKQEGSVLTFIQNSLKKHYCLKDAPAYLSGIIIMETGTAKIHVMPDFVESLNSDAEVNNWLRFFHVQAPFIGFAVIGSHDPNGLGLRLEHCHGFTVDRKIAGHLHYDTTAETVEYTGYFVIPQKLLRQDRI